MRKAIHSQSGRVEMSDNNRESPAQRVMTESSGKCQPNSQRDPREPDLPNAYRHIRSAIRALLSEEMEDHIEDRRHMNLGLKDSTLKDSTKEGEEQ